MVPHDPPSKVILEEFNRTHEVLQESKLLKVAEKVLLPRDETEMWFQHLKKVHENRQTERNRKGCRDKKG